jgi:hypothetical protein
MLLYRDPSWLDVVPPASQIAACALESGGLEVVAGWPRCPPRAFFDLFCSRCSPSTPLWRLTRCEAEFSLRGAEVSDGGTRLRAARSRCQMRATRCQMRAPPRLVRTYTIALMAARASPTAPLAAGGRSCTRPSRSGGDDPMARREVSPGCRHSTVGCAPARWSPDTLESPKCVDVWSCGRPWRSGTREARRRMAGPNPANEGGGGRHFRIIHTVTRR